MEKIVLNNRYKLLNKIGSGGMAHVYKALDTTLDRIVAIKILKEEFLEDEEFIKRFHAEALAVAKLSNPNIVGVFDVALEDKYHYIVMEYIDGVTLSDYIISKKVLSDDETLSIAIQICKALVHAHDNSIIHRDIKPHNILLAKDGVAKVTDFGIAKATTNKTLTLSGRTIGSVHYFSPEQARGGYVDFRTDLYSLGCVIYEMLTGEVPYEGETPVVVAVKHIQEPVKSPKSVNENIGNDINNIVIKAMAKSVDERFQNSQILLETLESLVKGKELPKEFDLTLDFINGKSKNNNSKSRMTKAIDNTKMTKEIREEYDFTLATKRHKRYTFPKIIAVFSAILLILLLSFYGIKELLTTFIPEVETYEVSNYRDLEFDEVKIKLEDEFNIIVEKNEVYSDDIIRNIIIEQSIAPGIVFKELAVNKIIFTVSLGPELIEIKDYTAFDYRIAERDLKELGLIPVKEEVTSETVAKGGIIRTDPEARMEVPPNTTITVYVSKGPDLEEVVVPDFINMTLIEFDETLELYNLVRGEVLPNGDISDTARIISQAPKALETVYEMDEIHVVFQEENLQGERLLVKNLLKPLNMESLPDPVKVYVEYLPTDTLVYQILYNQEHAKSDFPVEIVVPIPIDGKSTIKVIYDNKHTEYYELLYEDYASSDDTTIDEGSN